MPTFQRCPKAVELMAAKILSTFETHKPMVEAGVTVDYVFAYPDYHPLSGAPTNDALTKNGVKALGICKIIGLKERALGRADAEISLDGHHWDRIDESQQMALLDHELHHIEPKADKRGLVTDDLGRPVIKMRKHDWDIGWFKVIAARHGSASIEQQQAKTMMDDCGQYFWPLLSNQLKAA